MNSQDVLYEYKGNYYPNYLKEGNAASYIIPYAKLFCKGNGLDIGGYLDWTFPDAKQINIVNEDEWDAYNLPDETYDFIFSSHTLEHLPNYVDALRYWKSRLKEDGVLFLYLPHPDMEYWLPQNNNKHLHAFQPKALKKVLHDLSFVNILSSKRDFFWSFAMVAFMK